MAKIAYVIYNHHSCGAVGVMWLFHFVSQVSVCNHAKARFSGLVTKGGQNKPQIWNPRPQFAYSLYNFYRATMTIKGTLLLNNSIVKRSVEKKLKSRFN